MNAAKFFLRTLVGLFVGSVIGGIYTGSLFDFVTGLGMAIVCTLGLALLVIVPTAYLLGALLTCWFIPIGGTSWTRPPSRKPSGSSLEAYIRAARADGTSEDTLTQELLDAGWKPERVRQALAAQPPRQE